MADTAAESSKEQEKTENYNHSLKRGWLFVLPAFLCLFIAAGINQVGSANDYVNTAALSDSEAGLKSRHKHEINFSALLANKEFSRNLRDTVYTDLDIWLELRIDQQMLYVHHRDGRLVKYPVSTGNPYLNKGLESRPGLFAIFMKEEVHLSSQFDNAQMNNYMPYNMGIGFHSLQGTGYYGNLGVRPSSHGCTRMKHEDARTLFKECPIGTLVLVHRGYSVRVVTFAPDGFKNDAEYSKDDYLKLMAYNLGTLIEGKYFINPPKRMIVDGKIIPKSGITVSSTQQLPDEQYLPFSVAEPDVVRDRVESGLMLNAGRIIETDSSLLANLNIEESVSPGENLTVIDIDEAKVKKYSHNPLGILPYFGPKK